jgi:hypothetical protein
MTFGEALAGILIFLFALSIVAGITYNVYSKRAFFQKNIANMTEVNKCFYICDYEYRDRVMDTYKACLEKCDRVNERNCVEAIQ